jgi:RNA ligase (TIGR02306 family)
MEEITIQNEFENAVAKKGIATIQEILDIQPIEGADTIEVVTVMGWQVVVKKSENYSIGELVIYVEIDSVLPQDNSNFEFMRPRKFRVKTIKLRGQISQGLILPISLLPVIPNKKYSITSNKEYSIGDDVSKVLNIKHYEKSEKLSYGPSGPIAQTQGKFPSHLISKTDEKHIQSCEKEYAKLSGKPYYISIKIDGTSSTFVMDKNKFKVCSRNYVLKPSLKGRALHMSTLKYSVAQKVIKYFPGFFRKSMVTIFFKLGFLEKGIPSKDENKYWGMVEKYNIQQTLLENPNIAIQGEIYGEGIQGNKLKIVGHDLAVFNIFNTKTQKYYGIEEMRAFCNTYRLCLVPIVEIGANFQYSIEELINRSKGEYCKGSPQEGLVIRERDGGNRDTLISFKCVNQEFLLRYGE